MIYNSGSVPVESIFSPRATSPPGEGQPTFLSLISGLDWNQWIPRPRPAASALRTLSRSLPSGRDSL